MIIVLKLIFKRARPPHHQTDSRFVGPDQHSFPSGHATRVGCIVALIFYLAEGTSCVSILHIRLRGVAIEELT